MTLAVERLMCDLAEGTGQYVPAVTQQQQNVVAAAAAAAAFQAPGAAVTASVSHWLRGIPRQPVASSLSHHVSVAVEHTAKLEG